MSRCACHTARGNPHCPLDVDPNWFEPSNVSQLEIRQPVLEHLLSSTIQCFLCQQQALHLVKALELDQTLLLPICLDLPPSPSPKWTLKFIGNARFAAKLDSSSTLPPFLPPPPPPVSSISDVFGFISSRVGPKLQLQVPCEETNQPDEDFSRFKYSMFIYCQNASQSPELMLQFAKQLDLTFDAIALGYSFLRVYYPESMDLDLVWVLNNARRDQAEFFHLLADLLRFQSSSARVVQQRMHDFFFKSLQVFENRQAWEALRYGLHLVHPTLLQSFVYRDVQPFYPFYSLCEFFLNVQTNRHGASRVLALTALQLAEKFTTADRWENFQQDAELLTGFCGNFFSFTSTAPRTTSSSSTAAEDLNAFLKREQGRLVLPELVNQWFGFAQITPTVLQDIALHFFQNRVSDYRKHTHDFLHQFLYQMNRDNQSDVFQMAKRTADAIYSIKIGTLAYGDLDWLLFHFQHTKHCLAKDGGSEAFKHVVGRHLLLEAYLQHHHRIEVVMEEAPPIVVPAPVVVAPVVVAVTPVIAAAPTATTTTATSQYSQQWTFSSLLEDVKPTETPPPPPLKPGGKLITTVTATPSALMPIPSSQVVEEWYITRPTLCVVRLPAVYFEYVTANANKLLVDTCAKANHHHSAHSQAAGSVVIEVVRAGKIKVAPSAFRVQSKVKDQTQLGVRLFREAVLNLGLCESRFTVARRSYSQIVGKNGERITSIRDRTGCKVFLSETSPISEELNLVCLFGLPDQVMAAMTLVKRYANDEVMLAKAAATAATAALVAANAELNKPPLLVTAGGVGAKKRQSAIPASPPSSPENRAPSSLLLKKCTDDVLFKAVQRRDWPQVQALIDREEGLYFVAPSGTTVLHKAAERNAPDPVLQALLQKGLNPNQSVLDTSYASLHFAIKGNAKLSVFALLISAGADVNQPCERGLTPLHLLVRRNGPVKVLQLLLDRGARTDLQEEEMGYTPLALAQTLETCSQELIQVLERVK
ncbi:hypothetical protein BASA81_010056 [Batrachochytrium salamandrivorans]|nr:hypothetical protein BASA81_010056 [Batrachochytrium salamandrivorans]